ncbi:MAG: glycosyltransferase family 2 protein, partial [Lentisphaeria bacterium]|nr:glycosyltransferase family 2 protein [Lentisphaeria bacterium]
MSAAQPKISVIIPVYNTEKYLPACLDSVLSQSLMDFEIVAVDDASTDGSSCILAGYAARDPRIRIVTHERNKGLLSVRLSGVRAAAGKYLLFLDSDDIFQPGFLKALWNTAEKHRADIVHFPLRILDRDRRLPPRLLRLAEKKSLPYAHELRGREVFRKYFVEHAYGWSAVQKLYLTEICRKAVEFIPDQFCIMGEDFCFYTICAFFAEHYVPEKRSGYVYFMDSGISSGQKTTLERFLGRQSPVPALKIVRGFLERPEVPDEYRTAFSRQEPRVLSEQFMRWMRYLPDPDRAVAFNAFFRQYDPGCLFAALREFFTGRDEHFLRGEGDVLARLD